jgi:hypothetical protein
MKQLLVGAFGVFACTAAIASFITPAQAQGQSQIQRGYAIAPVPLNTGGLNPALVGLGSYIVNAQGGCNDCHTNPPYAPGGDPFAGQVEVVNAAGYLGGGVAFGPFTSRNLTPRASDGRPAGLTLAEFTDALRRGTDYKNRHPEISSLLQVMPWPVYGKMSDREIQAIYEYLRAIPCVGSAVRCGA